MPKKSRDYRFTQDWLPQVTMQKLQGLWHIAQMQNFVKNYAIQPPPATISPS